MTKYPIRQKIIFLREAVWWKEQFFSVKHTQLGYFVALAACGKVLYSSFYRYEMGITISTHLPHKILVKIK